MTNCSQLFARPHHWLLLGVFLLAWNGLAALFANPLVMTQRWDGTQYQLLARNRLQGHYEVGDQADTVRREGRHPMFRPGLVWLEEGLARGLGSVRAAAAAASALAVTLLEWLLVWLAWRCYGRTTALVVLACLLLPLSVAGFLLHMAVGQGPEPWAAAMILMGLAALVEAVRRASWRWGLAAGVLAGFAEWFRTGSHLLFLVPCAVYGANALRNRQWRGAGLSAAAVVLFLTTAALGGMQVPSDLDKTTMNLWHRLVERQGLQLQQSVPGSGSVTILMGGLELAPGTDEIWYDHVVQQSRGISTRAFLMAHGGEILGGYVYSLGQVAITGAWGLRLITGDWLFACFACQIVLLLTCRRLRNVHTVAFAGAAIMHYLGPIVLFRGADPTHYILVALPLFLLVGVRGALNLAELLAQLGRRLVGDQAGPVQLPRRLVPVGLAVLALLSVWFYQGALASLQQARLQAVQEQAAVDALDLDGCRIACRDMTWFVDRDVETVLLPYASVGDLERYARAQQLDGILVWEDVPELVFQAVPYDSLAEFDRRMRSSRVFGPPRVSGSWRWYPINRAG